MSIIKRSKELWNSYGCSVLLALSLSFLLIVGFLQILSGKTGSWSSSYDYDPLKYNYYDNVDISKFYNVNKVGNSNINSNSKKQSKGEVECRRVLENIFKKPFPNKRPKFMNNEVTNFNLELDCYNPELSLAVEYNGKQHYKFLPYFHKNKEAFRNQQYRDYMKRELCKKYGINLIEVPYTVKVRDIETYIRKGLRKYGYII